MLTNAEKRKLRTEWKIRNWTKHYAYKGTFADILNQTLSNEHKCFEPVQRNKDGKRWIRHRFPIKGGISLRDIMIKQVMKTNRLMEFFNANKR